MALEGRSRPAPPEVEEEEEEEDDDDDDDDDDWEDDAEDDPVAPPLLLDALTAEEDALLEDVAVLEPNPDEEDEPVVPDCVTHEPETQRSPSDTRHSESEPHFTAYASRQA